jgi:hypothetical protein
VICPTCERTCADSEEVCLRCRTQLRAPPPVEIVPVGRSWGWLWGLLAVLLLGSVVRTCARVIGGGAPRVAVAAPVDEATASRNGFLTAFRGACLKRGNPASFCDCAGPLVLERFKMEELDQVVESTRNGRPDVRMSAIILECSK